MTGKAGRRPADRYKPGATPREIVWAELRRRRRHIVAREVALAVDVHVKTVSDYLTSLMRSGHLRAVGESPTALDQVYDLVRDTGVETPRVRRDGSLVEQGSGTEAMWRTMHVLREFTPPELAVHATTPRLSVSEATAQSYVSALYRAGYLARKAGSGRKSVYLLVRRSGPRPPQVQRVKRIFDPNTGEVFAEEAMA